MIIKKPDHFPKKTMILIKNIAIKILNTYHKRKLNIMNLKINKNKKNYNTILKVSKKKPTGMKFQMNNVLEKEKLNRKSKRDM